MTQSLLARHLNRMIGWESVLDDLVHRTTSNFPPYNLIKDENGVEIQLALAGYSKEDISVTLQDRILTISSGGVDKGDDRKYDYRGVAKRGFVSKFSLAQNHEVQDVSMKDGMLYVFVVEVVPDDKKVKSFIIN
jgi:molecular chaperone IbpA